MARCKTCDAEITWATSERTGRPMPLDAVPAENGNLALIAGRARPYTEADARLLRERYTSHFATCPDADQHRSAR